MSDNRRNVMLHYAKKLAEYCEETPCGKCPFVDAEKAHVPAFCLLHDHTPVSWLPMIHQIQQEGGAENEQTEL